MIGGFPRNNVDTSPVGLIDANSGRSIVKQLTLFQNINKIYLPNFICSDLYFSIAREGVQVAFYEIDEEFYPVKVPDYQESSLVIIVNFFGVLDTDRLRSATHRNCILDSTHNLIGAATYQGSAFNSWRKFLPVPDGASFYTLDSCYESLQQPSVMMDTPSSSEMNYLFFDTKCYDEPDLDGFRRNEKKLDSSDVLGPCKYSYYVKKHYDMNKLKDTIHQNFSTLIDVMGPSVALTKELPPSQSSPLYFPILCSKINYEELYRNKIFVPQLWNDFGVKGMLNERYKKSLLAIPLRELLSDFIMQKIKEAIEQ